MNSLTTLYILSFYKYWDAKIDSMELSYNLCKSLSFNKKLKNLVRSKENASQYAFNTFCCLTFFLCTFSENWSMKNIGFFFLYDFFCQGNQVFYLFHLQSSFGLARDDYLLKNLSSNLVSFTKNRPHYWAWDVSNRR